MLSQFCRRLCHSLKVNCQLQLCDAVLLHHLPPTAAISSPVLVFFQNMPPFPLPLSCRDHMPAGQWWSLGPLSQRSPQPSHPKRFFLFQLKSAPLCLVSKVPDAFVLMASYRNTIRSALACRHTFTLHYSFCALIPRDPSSRIPSRCPNPGTRISLS